MPLLGVNLGHVGFLAEAEREDLDDTVQRVVAGDYAVEERMTLDVTAHVDGAGRRTSWALNEASVEKAARERMLEVVVEVDGRPLSPLGLRRRGVATPTGSTAYAFSAGGSGGLAGCGGAAPRADQRARAVRAAAGRRPQSMLAIELVPDTQGTGVAVVRRPTTLELPPGARVEVRRGADARAARPIAPRRSPTGSSPSSTCRRGGAVGASATAAAAPPVRHPPEPATSVSA